MCSTDKLSAGTNSVRKKLASARTVRALRQLFLRSRSEADRQNHRAHSIPKKFVSGRAFACSVRNVPFPIPISNSTG